jgi:hypothetical protein
MVLDNTGSMAQSLAGLWRRQPAVQRLDRRAADPVVQQHQGAGISQDQQADPVDTSIPADPTSTVLQNCASNPDKFFMLTSSTQIVSAFNTIGTQLSRLRVVK